MILTPCPYDPINNVVQARALRGGMGVAQAVTQVAVTLDDGRQLTDLFDLAGTPLVPGLVAFDSDTSDAASIHSSTGVVTLRGNHWSSVVLTASIPSASASGQVRAFLHHIPVITRLFLMKIASNIRNVVKGVPSPHSCYYTVLSDENSVKYWKCC